MNYNIIASAIVLMVLVAIYLFCLDKVCKWIDINIGSTAALLISILGTFGLLGGILS